MTALTDIDAGATAYEAAIYYDDCDNPIAREGPSSYERSERGGGGLRPGRPARTARRAAGRPCADGAASGRAGSGTPAIRRGRTAPSSRTPSGRAPSWQRTTSEREPAAAGTDRTAARLGRTRPPVSAIQERGTFLERDARGTARGGGTQPRRPSR